MMRVGLACSLTLLVACGDVVTNKPDAPPVDPCEGVTCECTAATEVADCGAHARCNESGPGRVCECVAAYAKSGGACAFTGAPANPEMTDPAIWASVGTGPTIEATAPGNVDAGEAVLDQTSMCGLASFKQTFTMPPLDRAEPFKLVVTHTLADPNFSAFVQTTIGVGKQWMDLPVSRNLYRTDSFCLGAEAYGGPVDFRVASVSSPNCASQTMAKLRIDRVAVQVADPGECPMPGSTVNGNFEGSTGWTFAASGGSATGGITAAAGEGASAGGRITGVNRCSEGTLSGTIALPTRTAVPNQAIDMFVAGNSFDRMVVGLGGKNVQTVIATNPGKHIRMCVPAWASGTTTQLSFFMQRFSDNACTTALARQFSIDNITVVSDPACSVATDVTDPGFERAANVTGPITGWGLTNGYVNDTEGVNVNLVNSPAIAHAGNIALRMFWSNQCTGAEGSGADVAILVPPASGTAGPAVKFFSNSPAANSQTVTRLAIIPKPNSLAPWSVDAAETGAYVQSTLCLPPQFVGRPVRLRATLGNTGGGGCIGAQPTETATFDDFEVTTDATCPAQ